MNAPTADYWITNDICEEIASPEGKYCSVVESLIPTLWEGTDVWLVDWKEEA